MPLGGEDILEPGAIEEGRLGTGVQVKKAYIQRRKWGIEGFEQSNVDKRGQFRNEKGKSRDTAKRQ